LVIERLRSALARASPWSWLALFVFLLGSALRIEHAFTFDQHNRASDYHVHLLGVRWTMEHWRPFNMNENVNYQVRSYPPLWYFLSAAILELRDRERDLVWLSLCGWCVRHIVLWKILNELLPRRPLSRLAGLTIHALLPLGVLIDGKVNPEAFHSGLFAVALYILFRIEQRSRSGQPVSALTGAAFGVVTGIALLTKITAAMLLVLGPVVFGFQALVALRAGGLGSAFRKWAAPAAAAAFGFWIVAGFWVAGNYASREHPFPHVWDLDDSTSNATLADPVLYRRPLGWALPFLWKEYFEFPVLRSPWTPRPNFWATEVIGTWSDLYNRGFCRLKGGAITDFVWGGHRGFMPHGSDVWSVNQRCVEWFSSMAKVGSFITAASVLAVFFCLFRHLRTWGARSSLILAAAPLLGTFSAMRFALAYPYDEIAALNPRYLLSQVMPMSACLSLALSVLEARQASRSPRGVLARALLWTVVAAIVAIGAMLIYERFGR
jgi:hypothetical protein